MVVGGLIVLTVIKVPAHSVLAVPMVMELKKSYKRFGDDRGRSRTKRQNQNSEKKKNGSGEYSSSTTNACRKCLGRHSSTSCSRYPFYYEKLCHICKSNGKELYHPADLCRFAKSRYITPSPVRSPVSYNRKKDTEGSNQKGFFY